jgi:hypothetical protein
MLFMRVRSGGHRPHPATWETEYTLSYALFHTSLDRMSVILRIDAIRGNPSRRKDLRLSSLSYLLSAKSNLILTALATG